MPIHARPAGSVTLLLNQSMSGGERVPSGSLAATARIVIRESAVIHGSLSAPVLSVVEGAQLSGKVDIAGQKTGAGLKLAS